MPIPNPKGPEAKKSFISRCMFPDSKQRYAVCQSKYKNAKSCEYKQEEEDSEIIIY